MMVVVWQGGAAWCVIASSTMHAAPRAIARDGGRAGRAWWVVFLSFRLAQL